MSAVVFAGRPLQNIASRVLVMCLYSSSMTNGRNILNASRKDSESKVSPVYFLKYLLTYLLIAVEEKMKMYHTRHVFYRCS